MRRAELEVHATQFLESARSLAFGSKLLRDNRDFYLIFTELVATQM